MQWISILKQQYEDKNWQFIWAFFEALYLVFVHCSLVIIATAIFIYILRKIFLEELKFVLIKLLFENKGEDVKRGSFATVVDFFSRFFGPQSTLPCFPFCNFPLCFF